MAGKDGEKSSLTAYCNEFFVYYDSMGPDELNASERIIRRFGGQTALANLLGRRQSTIEHWASTGRIPAQWHQPLMSLARQKGIVLEAKDFVTTQPHQIAPAGGRLGVLLVGLGAVGRTPGNAAMPQNVLSSVPAAPPAAYA